MSKEEQKNNEDKSADKVAKEDFIDVSANAEESSKKTNDDFSVIKPVIEWGKENKLKLGIAGGVCILAIAIIGIAGSTGGKPNHQGKKPAIHQISESDGGAYKVQGVTTANTIAKRNTKTYLSEQLSVVSAKISSIQSKMNNQKTVVDLGPIKQQLQSVDKQVQEISKKSNQYISIAIKEQTKLLTAQLKDIKKEVNQLKPQADGRIKVALKSLPFKIVAIDNIQGDNIVSVTYDYRTVPLSLNDTLVGWKLAKVDFTHQTAEFTNNKKEYVSFDMNEVAG
tara:strand:- start:6278 stop:7120 length:843 start_codon:yes stop_codon:yes gene_type:complete